MYIYLNSQFDEKYLYITKLTSSRSAPFSTAHPSTAWYRIRNPVSPVCSRPCHDTNTDFVWMSWMATFKISGWLQKYCGSSWANINPCSSMGCSHRSCGASVESALAEGAGVCVVAIMLDGKVVSSERVHLEWSPSHCQSSWESQVQLSGFSAGIENCLVNTISKQTLTD